MAGKVLDMAVVSDLGWAHTCSLEECFEKLTHGSNIKIIEVIIILFVRESLYEI